MVLSDIEAGYVCEMVIVSQLCFECAITNGIHHCHNASLQLHQCNGPGTLRSTTEGEG